ncbi:hypothetical protein MFRU_006g02060 [Monilinia fructicola]|nr:hypothetical protein MFRU_006g02060 [Monilinia fructicola]
MPVYTGFGTGSACSIPDCEVLPSIHPYLHDPHGLKNKLAKRPIGMGNWDFGCTSGSAKSEKADARMRLTSTV